MQMQRRLKGSERQRSFAAVPKVAEQVNLAYVGATLPSFANVETAHSRLYRSRLLHPHVHFAAFVRNQ